jgi:hypothetical protein
MSPVSRVEVSVTRFDAIIAIDWSGARDPSSQRAYIWCCYAEPGAAGCLEVISLNSGRTRAEVVAWLIEEARQQRLLVGFDFAFSLPWGYVAHQLGRQEDTWLDVVAFCAERGEKLLAECPPPFWGRRGTRKPRDADLTVFGLTSLYRRTDIAVGTAKSAFQIGGPGAVGTGTLRGIPLLGQLRQAGYHIWPFDGPPGDTRQSVVVEIYPRLFVRPRRVTKSDRAARDGFLRQLGEEGNGELIAAPEHWAVAVASEDGFDAFISVVKMGKEQATPGQGFARYGPDFYADPVIASEGWIWGQAFEPAGTPDRLRSSPLADLPGSGR